MSASRTVDQAALPEGWQSAKVGDHFEFKNGLNKAKHFFGHGTPIINYMDVYRHPWLLPSQVSGKVSVTRTEQQAYSAMQHDAFFTRTSETVAEIGMCSVLMGPIERAVFSGFVLRARPFGDGLFPGFAAYALRSRKVREQIESSATYTTRALTNGRSLSTVNFALPPKPEQQRITTALRDIDDLIASLDSLIAKKRDIKQAAMQQLLTGRTRLPGFDADWSTSSIGDIAEVDPESLPSSTAPDWALRYVSLEDVSHGVLAGHSKIVFASAPSRARRRIKSGDILFGTVRPNLKSHCLFRASGQNWVGSTGFCVIRCLAHAAHASFVFHQIMAENISKQIERIIAGSNYPAISSRDVRGLLLNLPYIEEQRAIANTLDDMDAEIMTLETRMAKFQAVREGAMQQLLTGRIRLV